MTLDTPWRDGYRVRDPGRPCYTCGSPPRYIDRSGEPVYPSTCLHEAITPDPSTLDFTDYGPITIDLSDDEYERARKRAEDIVRIDEERGWSMYFTPGGGETRLDVNVRGFGAELAAHRATGLPLNWSYLGRRYKKSQKPPDLGARTEVRNARRRDGLLVAHKGEKPERLYLLVVGEGRRYVVCGWMEGADLMVPARWREPPVVRHEGYFAGQAALRPVAEIPEDA